MKRPMKILEQLAEVLRIEKEVVKKEILSAHEIARKLNLPSWCVTIDSGWEEGYVVEVTVKCRNIYAVAIIGYSNPIEFLEDTKFIDKAVSKLSAKILK